MSAVTIPEIPPTSRTRYLTGMTALNVPAPENTGGDWHFHDAFLDPRTRFFVGGSDFIDTNALLGAYGVHECSAILRRLGLDVPAGLSVYSANHYRAILDLVLRRARKGSNVLNFLTPHDFLDNDDELAELIGKLDEIAPRLTQTERKFVDSWRTHHKV